jgi:murein L,D-transpeptidase YcbB/YkuD
LKSRDENSFFNSTRFQPNHLDQKSTVSSCSFFIDFRLKKTEFNSLMPCRQSVAQRKQRVLRKLFALLSPFILIGCTWPGNTSELKPSGSVQSLLQQRIAILDASAKPATDDFSLQLPQWVQRFYQSRYCRPAWITTDGYFQNIKDLLVAIRSASQEALDPGAYHLQALEQLVQGLEYRRRAAKPQLIVNVELLATDAFFTYASHLLNGRINPQDVDPQWRASVKQTDWVELLQVALATRQVAAVFSSLMPAHAGYNHLRSALLRFRNTAKVGGWPAIPEGSPLQNGDHGLRVLILRARLRAEDEQFDRKLPMTRTFDVDLKQAVYDFQRRYGLRVDGTVGGATLATLNVSIADRIRQIELNMERWRWLPQYFGKRYLIVNIANFELQIVENEKRLTTMRAAVGQDYRQTPVFSTRLTRLVLNPHWFVPKTIAVEDMLPRIKEDPAYLARRHLRVFQGSWDDPQEIDALSIDWSAVTAENFNYRLRQDPGPANALGRMKFILTNPYDVYIHDTPAQDQFKQMKRTFSSGCIRIEDSVALAEYLLRDHPQWSPQKLRIAIESGIPQIIQLTDPVPVHIVYWTAWTDENSHVHFREDVYGRDRALDKALQTSGRFSMHF